MTFRRGVVTGTSMVVGLMMIALAALPAGLAGEAPSASALLRGVESVRKPTAPLKATFVLEDIAPPPSHAIECVVECDGPRRRFQHSAGGPLLEEIVIRDGDEFRYFQRKEGEGVVVMDSRRAIGQRGVVCFDPRIIGLADLMGAGTVIRGCLHYEEVGDFETVGREEINGTPTWRVKATADSTEYNFWIEEPSFRVHRKTIRMGKFDVEVRSEYDASDPTCPLPKRVHIKRVTPVRTLERKITVTSVEWPAAIPLERFTLKSMNLPIGTPVDDYRSHTRLGYWNGEGLSESPVFEPVVAPEVRAPEGSGRRWIVLVSGGVLLAFLLVLMLRRSRLGANR